MLQNCLIIFVQFSKIIQGTFSALHVKWFAGYLLGESNFSQLILKSMDPTLFAIKWLFLLM